MLSKSRQHYVSTSADDTVLIMLPSDCIYITNIHNAKNCKMVTYYQDGQYLKEAVVVPSLSVAPGTTIIMYGQGLSNNVLSFDVYRYTAKL